MTESPNEFVIENREHLLGLLAEAAEVEHDLMCCYLYAAFSLKERPEEDLIGDRELAAVKRWRREIVGVAVEEMAHLALVANVMAAVGGVPHFGRYNFPIPPGALPARLVVKLAPFCEATLDHFIFLERPHEATITDGDGFLSDGAYHRVSPAGRLMPTPSDYDTVGALYRAIRDGLQRLVERDGEAAVFVGDPALQLDSATSGLAGVTRVRCLASACTALDQIVVQGEGAEGHTSGSHYERFLAIRRELDTLRDARPTFRPGRRAAHNPVMRAPPEPEGRVWIQLQPAADVLDLANAAYNHMLRLLAQAYAETRGARPQRALVIAAVELMRAITPVASVLTTLPASADHPDCTAGMSFATVRGNTALPASDAADRVVVERLVELAGRARVLAPVIGERVAGELARVHRELGTALGVVAVQPPAPPPPPPVPPTNSDPVEIAEGAAIRVRFHGKRCVHARNCVLGLPGVFKANVDGPWIDADATHVEAVAALTAQCPSGALQFERKDGGPNEAAPGVNVIHLRENGPLAIRANLTVAGQPLGYRATLCRCGHSARKPFCDGSHVLAGFDASGEPPTRDTTALSTRDGVLEVHPQANGPLVVVGNVEICAGTGRTIERTTRVRLCRCGGSSTKPFCDGTHGRNGFVADGE